jgi:phosphohistidine phosphatase
MHRLHLLRHAKSSWKDDVDDRDRPLTRRGRDNARILARHLPAAIGPLDLVLCSSARRTRETLDLVLAETRIKPKSAIEDGLYLAGRAELIDRLRRLPEAADNVLVIGHNPGLHELALALAAPGSPGFATLADGKFPTAALVSFQVAGLWSALDRSRHDLVDYVTPASLAAEED